MFDKALLMGSRLQNLKTRADYEISRGNLTVPVDAHDLSEVVRFYYECIEVLGFLTTHPQIHEATQNFSPEDKEQLTALINQMAFGE